MTENADTNDSLRTPEDEQEAAAFLPKIKRLWARYRGFLLGVIAAALFVAAVVAVTDSMKKTTVISGIAVNVRVSDEGVSYLREQFKEHLGVESDRKVIYFSQSSMEKGNDSASMDNYYTIRTLNALCANGEIDYMILDQVGFEVALNQKLLADLHNVLTDEQLQTMTGMLEYYQTEGSEEIIPIALNVTDTAFIREYTEEDCKVYLVFAKGSPRTETCQKFLSYLLEWNQ